MFFLDMNFHGISLKKWKLHLYVVMKETENFPKKSELPKFTLLVKIDWLIFFYGFQGGIKNLQRSELAYFLVL